MKSKVEFALYCREGEALAVGIDLPVIVRANNLATLRREVAAFVRRATGQSEFSFLIGASVVTPARDGGAEVLRAAMMRN